VQLIDAVGAPYDVVAGGGQHDYDYLMTPKGLSTIAQYADAIGVHKDRLIPRSASGSLARPTSAVQDAHAAGLLVHAWTFRAENAFLPRSLRSSRMQSQAGNLAGELEAFLNTGLDGFFTDHPDIGAKARNRFTKGVQHNPG
jgi:glycerophosphoryl diester phosphodiesterase